MQANYYFLISYALLAPRGGRGCINLPCTNQPTNNAQLIEKKWEDCTSAFEERYRQYQIRVKNLLGCNNREFETFKIVVVSLFFQHFLAPNIKEDNWLNKNL